MPRVKNKAGQQIEINTHRFYTTDEMQRLVSELDASTLKNILPLLKAQSPTSANLFTKGGPVESGNGAELPDEAFSTLAKHLGAGAVQGGIGYLTGNIPGAIIGGLSGLAFPPETKGQVAGDLLADIPLGNLVVKTAIGSKFPWLSGLASGAGQYLASDKTREMIDTGEANFDAPTAIGSGIMGLLGASAGKTAANARTSSPIQELNARSRLTGKLSTFINPPLKLEEFALKNPGTNYAEPIRDIFAQASAPKNAELVALAQEKALAEAKVRQTMVAQKRLAKMQSSHTQAIDKAYEALDVQNINLEREINQRRIDLRGITEYEIDPATGKKFAAALETKPPDYDQLYENFLRTQFRSNPGAAANYIDFYKKLRSTGLTPQDAISADVLKLDPGSTTALKKVFKDAEEAPLKQLAEAKEVARKKTEEEIAALRDAQLELKIRRAASTSAAVSGVGADPALRASVQNSQIAKARALELGINLQEERNEVLAVKEAVTAKKKEEIFGNAALRKIMKPNANGLLNDETLVGNMINAPQEVIRDTMAEFSSQPHVQEAFRNTYLTNILRSAYDPQLKAFDFAKLSEMTDLGKISELFGGGSKGRATAASFQDFLAGVEKLQQLATYNQSLQKLKTSLPQLKGTVISGAASILGSGILFRYSHTKAGAAVAAASLLHLPFNKKLIDAIANKPNLGKQFLNWAATGGTSTALSSFPAVNALFKTAASEVE